MSKRLFLITIGLIISIILLQQLFSHNHGVKDDYLIGQDDSVEGNSKATKCPAGHPAVEHEGTDIIHVMFSDETGQLYIVPCDHKN